MWTSITLVRCDDAYQAEGYDPETIKGLFCMHDPAVRQWIGEQQAGGAYVVVAPDEWRNPGGDVLSLTFPIIERDAEALARITAMHVILGYQHDQEAQS